MSIRVKQIGRIANKAINSFLQDGNFPTVNAILSSIYAKLNGTIPGNPQSKFTNIPKGSLTNPISMTANAEVIGEDVQNLYDENIDLVNRIVRDFDSKSTRRERIVQRIISLNNLVSSSSLNQNIVNSSFSSLLDIDTNNTTAAINFREFSVSLPASTNGTVKIDLSQASITVTTDGTITATRAGDVNNILTDKVNEAFCARVSSTTQTATMTFTVTLPAPALVSRIEAAAFIGSVTGVKLILDTDPQSSQIIDLTRRVSWDVSARQVTTFTLILAKTKPDDVSGAIYFFDFGLKNLSIYYEEYIPTAVITTAPINFNNQPLGSINLTANQTIPSNCDIDWSFSTSGPNGNFKPITPGISVVIGSSSLLGSGRIFPVTSINDIAKSFVVSNDITLASRDQTLPVLSPIRGSRTPLFTLLTVPVSLVSLLNMGGSVTLTKGRNAWRVRSYHYDTNDTGLIQNPPPTIDDFITPRGTNPSIYTRYQPTDFDINNQFSDSTTYSALRLPTLEYPQLSDSDQVMHLFEANLIVNPQLAPSVLANLASTTVSLSSIFAISGNTGSRAALYCNGVRVGINSSNSLGSLSYSAVINLIPGSNIIQIVTNNYVSLSGNSFEFGTALFSSIAGYGSNVMWYADAGPMTQVALFELQYQTARNDFSRFCITTDPVTGKEVILVRELPTTVYDINVNVINSSVPNSLVLQAILSGSNISKSLTPKISSYSLAMEY